MSYMEKIGNWVKGNKFFQWIYSQEQDLNIGRGFFSKFTNFSQELSLVILITTLVFHVDIKENMGIFIMWCFIVIFFIFLFGKFYRKINMMEVDQRANTMRNPLGRIQLTASETILREFGPDSEYHRRKYGRRKRRC